MPLIPALNLQVPRNLLLSCLPAADYQRLAVALRPINLPHQMVLYEPHQNVERIYFLESGMISMVMEAREGKALEVGIIGREGMLGLHTVQDSQPSFTRAIMQVPGKGWWLPRVAFEEEYRRGGVLSALVLQHLQMMLAQTAQSALCCAVHTGIPRLCRWLLQARLCTGQDELALTHEFLAEMLGTQRASVTLAIGQIESTGAISTRRGVIQIVDAPVLEGQSCSCYATLVRRYRDLTDGYQQAGRQPGSVPN